jgi:hypothetical protein
MKYLSFLAVTALCVAVFAADTGNRKKTTNEKSPSAETSISLGGKNVTIEYNAPSARGRKVEGGLVPYGKVWRLGADSATTLTTEADIMIGNVRVPKGVHTLYVMASESGWKLVVNKQTGQWGTVYNEPQDLGRVDMNVTKASAPVETMKITLQPAGMLVIEWGETRASVPVKLA